MYLSNSQPCIISRRSSVHIHHHSDRENFGLDESCLLFHIINQLLFYSCWSGLLLVTREWFTRKRRLWGGRSINWQWGARGVVKQERWTNLTWNMSCWDKPRSFLILYAPVEFFLLREKSIDLPLRFLIRGKTFGHLRGWSGGDLLSRIWFAVELSSFLRVTAHIYVIEGKVGGCRMSSAKTPAEGPRKVRSCAVCAD
jgi:hypothetical protein